MTGPRVDIPPMRRVLSPTEFEAAQQLPTTASLQGPMGNTGVSRVLSPDEFEHAQTLPGPAVAQWKIPTLPAIAPRDVTQTPTTSDHKGGTKIPGVLGAVMRQAINPMIENPLTTLAMGVGSVTPGVNVLMGLGMGGEMVHHIASYGWQKAAEMTLNPHDRKLAEADPERISGESAAVQAAMLGLAPLIHVGVKSFMGPDYGAGMFAGASDAAASTAPHFRPGFNDGMKASQLAASLEQGADYTATRQRFGVTADAPKGFEPTTATTSRAGAGAKPVEGMIAPEDVKPGKVAALPTEDPAAPLAEHADLSNTITDGIAELRRQDAERASRIRRRPKDTQAPFFETEQGAQTLGATAARHGLPDDANPYHAESMPAQAAAWQAGHGAATESFPEGFSMGGALNDNRIPADYQVPRVPGFEPHVADVPDGVTHETIALADALKPSRFRGHSESELIGAAVDAQARMEQAQQAAAHSGEGASGFSDLLRGDNTKAEQDAGGNPVYSPGAERELIRAKSQLTQIEREATLRGITGDDLAQRINDEKAARAERDAMQQDETLAAHAGADDPFADGTSTGQQGGLQPVDGTGETKTRGLSRGVQAKALANHLDATVGELPEYRTVNMADQSEMAVQLLEQNPALARQVALGQAPAPHGLLPESVFVAVENHAIETGDVGTIRELATGKLTSEATTMGQRIRALAERDPDSPVAAIKKVVEVRMGGAKEVPKATDAMVATIKKQLKDLPITAEKWASFVDSLRCS